MSRLAIPRDDDGNATPSWQRYEPDAPSAIVICPNGHNCAIGIFGITRHTIAADGEVNPSVVCPECDFHEFVRLDGWEP